MPELPILSHCTSRRFFKFRHGDIYEPGSVTVLALTSNFDCQQRCRRVFTIL